MDAAVFHVLWCLVLQTSVNRCTQLVLDPLGNVKPVPDAQAIVKALKARITHRIKQVKLQHI